MFRRHHDAEHGHAAGGSLCQSPAMKNGRCRMLAWRMCKSMGLIS
jgi:hypothetical protein